MAIVVSILILFSISSGSFNSECFLGEGGGLYTFLYPAFLVVLFWLAFFKCFSLLIVLFRGSPHVTACGRVISHNGKQVVNRLKIPQGLSTLLFHRWSEVPSRGGVHGDSP